MMLGLGLQSLSAGQGLRQVTCEVFIPRVSSLAVGYSSTLLERHPIRWLAFTSKWNSTSMLEGIMTF